MSSSTRLRGPSELLAVLPYQLGYHASNSLVLIAFHGARMGLVQRADLPAPGDAAALAATLTGPLLREGAESVVVVGYESAVGDSLAALDAAAVACADVGLAVNARVVVRGDRWFDPDCDGPCCPDGGTPLLRPADLPVVAEFVGREIAPLPDRAWLAASVGVADVEAARRVTQQARRLASARVTEGADRAGASSPATELPSDLRAWALLLTCEDDALLVAGLSGDMLGRLAVSLQDVQLRDALVSWLCPALPDAMVDPGLRAAMTAALPPRPAGTTWDGSALDGSASDGAASDGSASDGSASDGARAVALQRVQGRLVDLCACLEDEWAAPPLTVLGAFAWWRGDGALARVALERALHADPAYRLALLLEQMVDLGIRPPGTSG